MSIQREEDTFETGPFADWIRLALRRGVNLKQCGLDHAQVTRLLSGSQARVSIKLVDTVLSRAGEPLELIYPYEGEIIDDVDGKQRACKGCGFEERMNKVVGGWECAGCGHYMTRLPHRPNGRRFINDEILMEYARGGFTIGELAAKHGISFEGLRSRLHIAGLPVRGPGGCPTPRSAQAQMLYGGWDNLAREARRMRQQGWAWKQIADELGYSSYNAAIGAVKLYCKKRGLKWPV